MGFTYTQEQLNYFQALEDAVNTDEDTLLKIQAVAGASKSSSTVEAVRRVYDKNPGLKIRYLVFNTGMAAEAKADYKHMAIASTLHSLAYHHTVGPYKLNKDIAPWISWKDIPKNIKIPFGTLPIILDQLNAYLESKYTSFSVFVKEEAQYHKRWMDSFEFIGNQILDAMATGKMKITHAFYLKLFHILVKSGQVNLDPADILIIDECQDLTPITLDVFDAYPAKVKVMVGDQAQAIYGFMGCVSAFDFYDNHGIDLTLSKSFRVSEKIAGYIENFCKTEINSSMDFKGMEYPEDPTIKTHAYIFRTNLAMIRTMCEFNRDKKPYKLITKSKVKQLFELPLTLIYSKPGDKQYSPTLQNIQDHVDDWGKLRPDQRPSKLSYLLEEMNEVPAVAQAIKMIRSVGTTEIIEAYEGATEHLHSNANTILCTSHSSKGLTFDAVTLDASMDTSIEDIIKLDKFERDTEECAELYNYYVACTRARYVVNGANLLYAY